MSSSEAPALSFMCVDRFFPIGKLNVALNHLDSGMRRASQEGVPSTSLAVRFDEFFNDLGNEITRHWNGLLSV